MTFFEKCQNSVKKLFAAFALAIFIGVPAFAGEANLVVPKIQGDNFNLLVAGIIVSVLGLVWGLIAYGQIKSVKAHKAMIEIGNTIFETCKTYLVQQGKFLIVLEILIAICIAFYFGFLQEMSVKNVQFVLHSILVSCKKCLLRMF